MGRIIGIANQKGGVGKTTTVFNLGAALAADGYSVIMVDLDARADLTAYTGIDIPDDEATIYDALFSDEVALADITTPTNLQKVSLAPATADLAGAEMLLMGDFAERRHEVVADALAAIRGDYDFLLIDTPPGLQLLSVAAIVAADELVIPQQCSFLALHGLRQLSENIERTRSSLKPSLSICGIVMTMQDRRTIHNRQVIEMVRNGFGDLVFDAVIPTTIRLQEAVAAHQPITAYDPGSNAAKAYLKLAKEVVARAPKA